MLSRLPIFIISSGNARNKTSIIKIYCCVSPLVTEGIGVLVNKRLDESPIMCRPGFICDIISAC